MNEVIWISAVSASLMVLHILVKKEGLSVMGITHSVIWLVVSLFYALWQSDLEILTGKTLWVVVIGISLFSIACLLGARLGSSPSKLLHPQGLMSNAPAIPALILAVSGLGLMAMVYQAIELVAIDTASTLIGNNSWYASLRPALVAEKKGSYGIASYVMNFCFVGAAYLAHMSFKDKKSIWLWPTIIVALCFCIFATGRTYFILLGCLMIVVIAPSNYKRRINTFLLALAALLLITWVSGRFNQLSSTDFVASVERHAKLYFVAPLAAFNYLVNSEVPLDGGGHTFRTLLAIVKALGIEANVPNLVQEYPPVRLSANVYTVFSPYYRDFGVAGVAIFMTFLGLISGWVQKQVKICRSFVLDVICGILLYALLMQFFQDQYFSLLSQWVQLLFWAYMFVLLERRPLTEVQKTIETLNRHR